MILEGGQMGEVMGGYFIRRVVMPQLKLEILTAATSSAKKALPGPGPSARDNAENLISPVTGRVAGLLSAQPKPRKSPLPDWYPRTPLRDISLVCKAIERMNMRVNTTPKQMIKMGTKSNLAKIQFQTPELNNNNFLDTTHQIQPLKPDPTVLDFTPIRVTRTPEIEAYEKRLTESIDKLERIVKRNMKRERMKLKQNVFGVKHKNKCKMLMSMR